MRNTGERLWRYCMPKRARLDRLYAELCRYDWPAPPEGQLIPDKNGITYTVERPPMTPERIARVITDPQTLESFRYRVLADHEQDLWRLVKTRRGDGSTLGKRCI